MNEKGPERGPFLLAHSEGLLGHIAQVRTFSKTQMKKAPCPMASDDALLMELQKQWQDAQETEKVDP